MCVRVYLFVLRIIQWCCRVQHSFLSIVEKLRDVFQVLSRALAGGWVVLISHQTYETRYC